jgi:hypothetical protein
MGQNQIQISAILGLASVSCEEEYLQRGIYLQYTHTAKSVINSTTLYVESCFP